MSTIPELNEGLLLKVMDQIEADPKSWNQEYWVYSNSCGTTYCFAGWAVAFEAEKNNWDMDMDDVFVDNYSSRVGSIPGIASDLLGLTEGEATRLFSSPLTDPQMMRNLVKEVIEDRKKWDRRRGSDAVS